MNTLSKQYKEVFLEKLRPYGFLLYKKTFYRIINDVMQTLMLRHTSTNFTLDFSILPLSMPIKDLYCEGYDISLLGKKGWWDSWNWNVGLIEALSLFRQYVMPIFDRGIDSKSAYLELINYEKMIYTGIPAGIIHSTIFVKLCIQAGDYSKAYQHMLAIANRNEEMLEEHKNELQRLSMPDIEYYQNLTAKNTVISLEYLKQPRKTAAK